MGTKCPLACYVINLWKLHNVISTRELHVSKLSWFTRECAIKVNRQTSLKTGCLVMWNIKSHFGVSYHSGHWHLLLCVHKLSQLLGIDGICHQSPSFALPSLHITFSLSCKKVQVLDPYSQRGWMSSTNGIKKAKEEVWPPGVSQEEGCNRKWATVMRWAKGSGVKGKKRQRSSQWVRVAWFNVEEAHPQIS